MIRVGVVEDREEIREGLAQLLNGTDGCRSAASFASMEEAIAQLGGDLPDALLVDIGLPGMSGIDGIRVLHERYPSLVLLVLTIYEDDERIFAALCAGASGYLLKKTPPARLLESIREAVGGGAPMSPDIARKVVGFFQNRRPVEKTAGTLSPQEKRLLQLLVEGHHYKTAAAEMAISVNTVSFHLRRIYEKLQVHSKSEAVAKALRDGLAH